MTRYEGVRVKPKVRRRPQKVGDGRNIEYLVRNVTDSDGSCSKKEAMGPKTRKIIVLELPKTFGVHISQNPPQVTKMEIQDLMFACLVSVLL